MFALFWIFFAVTFITLVVTNGRPYYFVRDGWNRFRWHLRGGRQRIKVHQRHHWGQW